LDDAVPRHIWKEDGNTKLIGLKNIPDIRKTPKTPHRRLQPCNIHELRR
jgi:hypothetical protein